MYMELSEAILSRVSVRKWQDRKVEREKIVKVLEAARRAPSWGNLQPWRFIVIEEEKIIKNLAEASYGQRAVATAPVIIVCAGEAGDFSREKQRKSAKELIAVGAMDIKMEQLEKFLDKVSFDGVSEEVKTFRTREQIIIATAYMTLAAVDQGLGSLWIGGFEANKVHQDLNLPPNMIVHCMLALGYPGENPPPRPRKSLEEIAFFGGYKT
jgi:nitroreductase